MRAFLITTLLALVPVAAGAEQLQRPCDDCSSVQSLIGTDGNSNRAWTDNASRMDVLSNYSESLSIEADQTSVDVLGVTRWDFVTRNGSDAGFSVTGNDALSNALVHFEYVASTRGYDIHVEDGRTHQSARWSVQFDNGSEPMEYQVEVVGGDDPRAPHARRFATLKMFGMSGAAQLGWEYKASDGKIASGDAQYTYTGTGVAALNAQSFFGDPAVAAARQLIQVVAVGVFRDSAILAARKELLSPAVDRVVHLSKSNQPPSCGQGGSKSAMDCAAMALPVVLQAFYALGPNAGITCTAACSTAVACLFSAAGGGSFAVGCWGAATGCAACGGASLGANAAGCFRYFQQER